MAGNVTTGNHWILDTPAVITTDWVQIDKIRWVDATAVDHSMTLEDGAGKIIADMEATGDDFTEDTTFGDAPNSGRFHGLELAVLDSGIVHVYLK